MKNHSFKESFRNAANGFKIAFKEERHMRFHIVMTILVTLCSVLFHIGAAKTAVVLSLCGMVICAELINTAIENAVDICAPTFNMYAKKAKDAAAGAVLVMSIFAAAAGLIIFVPYGIKLIFTIIERI